MGVIRFIGLKQLDSIEQAKTKNLAEKYSGKFERYAKNINLVLNIKEYEKSGSRVKYALNVKATAPGHSAVSDASGWDMFRALHRAFKKIENELKHSTKKRGRYRR